VSRIAVIADFLEEAWPSMDLVAEQLATHLAEIENLESVLVRHPLRTLTGNKEPRALERALGRFVQLPTELIAAPPEADYFHIADHSYAHLALLFPRDRVGVYCHDIDAFRALLPGSTASRPRVLLSKLLLRGLRHATIVFHNSQAVRTDIVRYGFAPASRLVHAPLGIAAEFLRAASVGDRARPYLLHVGSCIPRKNVEFLLQIFSAARQDQPELELVQVGGRWTDAQRDYLESHQIGSFVVQKRGIPRAELAELYAGAALVLVPSLAEGFGLPVIEALACGTPVVASDIAVLREVGFRGVRFCSLSDVADWTRVIKEILVTRVRVSRETLESVRSRYSWHAHAATIGNAYANLATHRARH
jgi:glycosyltransferase involved in cell wall biosynthesis